ncbi:L-fucose isomerase [Citrobacter koseri]|uniref:L-fucose isomerase n=1 Tax=Citrobacter koseri TaxID=545 RepID=A0A3S4IDG7_CITKO|nr:L-fucose isomerase [Citrobacter koseri]
MKKISLPKIGIRPVIDGRRMGVRESLEEQTMNMAKATAALITEKLRHACGAQIECVIADTCIAGMAESAACEEKFSSQNVGVTITVTPCWCLRQRNHRYGPNAPESHLGLQMVRNVPAPFIWPPRWPRTARKAFRHSLFMVMTYRMPDDTSIPADVEEKLLRFARAGLAVASMKGRSYLLCGRRLNGDCRFHRRSQLL